MKFKIAILLFIILTSQKSFAQELPLILDKPGTFQILSRTDYTLPECGFTKAEMTANLQKLTELVGIMCKNPVLRDPVGFDGRARIYNTINCKEYGAYGVPSRISFEFAAWHKKKDGTPTRGFIEPPEWSLIINKIHPTGYQFSADDISADLRYFIVPLQKVTIEPGIDEYDGECYILYNPNRPPYWVSVTVKEVFIALIDHIKNDFDKIARDFILDLVEKEYAATSAEEFSKPAYYGGGQPVSIISSDDQYSPVVRANPEYWDKSLPKSSIQFIYFRMINNRPFLKSNTAEYLQHNSISYHLARFEESLDINMVRSLVPLIGKK